MEKVIDFDQWYLNHKIVIEYWAVYDPDTGKVKGIYPNESADEFQNKIKIPSDIAEDIGNGKISLANCFIDFESDTLEITEIKSLIKIDDLLHRIIEKKYAGIDHPDLIVSYDNKKLTFRLSDHAKGKKRIHYNGDTLMDFYITEYNDPNMLYKKISIKLDDLKNQDKHFDFRCDKRFSIFTRRIFKNYILIYENN